MLGNPKFKYKDAVKFERNDGTAYGRICIVDNFGTFADPSDASYDIIAITNSGPCVFKHIHESSVQEATEDELAAYNRKFADAMGDWLILMEKEGRL